MAWQQTTEQMALAVRELLQDALKHAEEDQQAGAFSFLLFYIVEDLRQALKFLDYAVAKLSVIASQSRKQPLATDAKPEGNTRQVPGVVNKKGSC